MVDLEVVKIAASILAADFKMLGEDVGQAEEGGADLLHIDVMDGHFVPNLGIGPIIVKSLRNITTLPFSVHLMVEEPNRFIRSYVDAGADIIIVHVEAFRGLYNTLKLIKKLGKKAGIALNPPTPCFSIKHLLQYLDVILIMSVDPGFGGQSFIQNMLLKIVKTRQVIDEEGLEIEVAVDGGVNERNALSVVRAGANMLVMGSAIFKHRDIKNNLRNIRQLVSQLD